MIAFPWARSVRELLAEQLHRFRNLLEELARGLRDRIAVGIGEALSTLVRALLGPGDIRSRPYEPSPPSWQRSPWEEGTPSDDGWYPEEGEPWPSSSPQAVAPVAAAPATPSTLRWRRLLWLAPLAQLWWQLCSSRFRPVVLSAVATGVAAAWGPAWIVPLVALSSSALGLIAMADRAADEACDLARIVEPKTHFSR